MTLFNDSYKGKRVFITGHTGFKGSWLALWLKELGAKVEGFSLPITECNKHFSQLKLDIKSNFGDIRHKEEIIKAIDRFKPEIIFHLAAQPLVRHSYLDPHETYETNVMGTLNVLEACRKVTSVQAIICVTTDKVYENLESSSGYDENSRLGGYDPYSSSKACSELLISSYTKSYFNLSEYEINHNTLLASVRGGNVIGGGDWSNDRIIPDIVKSIYKNELLDIRNPESIRPWQYVLDCLSGYLLLGEKLLASKREYSGSWNFGPLNLEQLKVKDILLIAKKYWPKIDVKFGPSNLHETNKLQLNCEKAASKLKWEPIISSTEVFESTFQWYKEFYINKKIISKEQLEAYFNLAKARKTDWVS